MKIAAACAAVLVAGLLLIVASVLSGWTEKAIFDVKPVTLTCLSTLLLAFSGYAVLRFRKSAIVKQDLPEKAETVRRRS